LVGRIRIIQAFSIEIALPSNVAEQLSGVGLTLVPRQQSQARFDNIASAISASSISTLVRNPAVL